MREKIFLIELLAVYGEKEEEIHIYRVSFFVTSIGIYVIQSLSRFVLDCILIIILLFRVSVIHYMSLTSDFIAGGPCTVHTCVFKRFPLIIFPSPRPRASDYGKHYMARDMWTITRELSS